MTLSPIVGTYDSPSVYISIHALTGPNRRLSEPNCELSNMQILTAVLDHVQRIL